jgi:membrane dipeptidase
MLPAAVRQTHQQLDVLQRLLLAYPAYFSPAPSSSSALSAFAQGRLISPFGIEGLHQIGNSPSILRSYYGLGVRYATLTHNCHNIFADAALTNTGPNNSLAASKPLHGGLSSAGVDLIKEMNRMGMIVDLSHVSHDTMLDVLGGNSSKFPSGSAAPVIFSHSSSYALCPHPRNVPDSLLNLVKLTNSLVMVNFNPGFISCIDSPDSPTGLPDFYPANSTIEHVVAHIKHIGDLIGYSHVGLGSDFDGIETTPQGLDDVSKYPALVAEMLRQGISDEDAGKVVGGNILRVWGDVEVVAEKLQREGQRPMEDDL